MARTISTDHNLPDIHDEGKIKRYGLSIAIAALIIIMIAFVVWATYTGQQNQRGMDGAGKSAQTSGGAQH